MPCPYSHAFVTTVGSNDLSDVPDWFPTMSHLQLLYCLCCILSLLLAAFLTRCWCTVDDNQIETISDSLLNCTHLRLLTSLCIAVSSTHLLLSLFLSLNHSEPQHDFTHPQADSPNAPAGRVVP